MRRSTLDKIRESLRLQQVYNVLLRYGWDVAFEHWEVLGNFHRMMQAWAWQLPEREEPLSTGLKIRLMLEELGPTYVKVGQIISSQASVIPADWEAELEKLQSDARPFASDQARQVFIEELGAPPEDIYATFEPVPFAAASTAQVHRAKLHDGRSVAVKVQRPHIYQQMKADIGIMLRAAAVTSRSSEWAKSVDLVGMIEQFGAGALNELDYGGEAYNALRLARNLQELPAVHIAEIHPEVSTSKILTQEFIRGVKISEVEQIRAAGLDPVAIAYDAFRAIIKQVLIDGFFHADPHPGNLLVSLNTGTITFIDTGMVGELDLSARVNIAQLLMAVQNGDVGSMAHIMRDLSVPFGDHVDEDGYYRDFERKIGRYFYVGSRLSFAQSVGVAFDLMREHGLRLDPNLTLAIKALMQSEAFTSALDPQGTVVADAVSMIKELLLTSSTMDMAAEEVKKQLTITGRELVKRIPSLSDATLKWVDQYQKGRFEVYVDTSGLSSEVDKLAPLGRQIIVGILLAGMIIGSAIATSLLAFGGAQSPLWQFLSRIAYIGYVLAMLIAAAIVVRLVWRWIRGK